MNNNITNTDIKSFQLLNDFLDLNQMFFFKNQNNTFSLYTKQHLKPIIIMSQSNVILENDIIDNKMKNDIQPILSEIVIESFFQWKKDTNKTKQHNISLAIQKESRNVLLLLYKGTNLNNNFSCVLLNKNDPIKKAIPTLFFICHTFKGHEDSRESFFQHKLKHPDFIQELFEFIKDVAYTDNDIIVEEHKS